MNRHIKMSALSSAALQQFLDDRMVPDVCRIIKENERLLDDIADPQDFRLPFRGEVTGKPFDPFHLSSRSQRDGQCPEQKLGVGAGAMRYGHARNDQTLP
jgi:hypothetical protein